MSGERREGEGTSPAEGPTPVRDALREAAEEATPPAPSPAAPGPEPTPSEPAGDRERRFEADGVEWIARIAGEGMAGKGGPGRAHILSIHFVRADRPDLPVREVLTAAGRFESLYDEELRDLLASARPVVRPEGRD